MVTEEREAAAPPARAPLTARWLVLALALYAGTVVAATYPVVRTLTSHVPGYFGCDQLTHLWEMHWYADCLRHLRSPLLAPGIQYPVGAPLGLYPPMEFQALLFIPLSWCGVPDVLSYNLIWFFNLLFTGMGTLLLIWYLLGDRTCALVGGLLVMLSGPVLAHANSHLEFITLGWFPLFLLAWMRWIDQPERRRFLLAGLAYLLVALSTPYYAIFAIIPAVLYVVERAIRQKEQPAPAWLLSRVPALVAFAVVLLPLLALIFIPQIASRWQGYNLPRSKAEFDYHAAPLWSYFIPSAAQFLGHYLPSHWYFEEKPGALEGCSYAGVVLLGLLLYAGWTKAPVPARRFWWSALAICVILSWGSAMTVAGVRVSLPAEWLWWVFYPFRLIRCPSRFNLVAMIFAAVLAAAGLQRLLRHQKGPRAVALVAALWLLALIDLAQVPFGRIEVPACPEGYRTLVKHSPEATFLDVPQYSSGGFAWLNALCGYWQALHQGRTTASYAAFPNLRYDELMFLPSPFAASRLQSAAYPIDAEGLTIDVMSRIRFQDVAWLYLQAHHLNYLVLHADPSANDDPAMLRRLYALLQPAHLAEQPGTAFYDSSRLPPPQQPTVLVLTGWHQPMWRRDGYCRAVSRQARLAAFSPSDQPPLRFTFSGASLHEPRTVHLTADGIELTRWQVTPDEPRSYRSPDFHLRRGIHDLVLETDGESVPRSSEETSNEDYRPYSLRIGSVVLDSASPDKP